MLCPSLSASSASASVYNPPSDRFDHRSFISYKYTSGEPVLRMEVGGAKKSHGCGQSVHGKSQNFLKHNVSCKSFWVIQAHSKS